MEKIGITGGIGSGKTTVCKIFELLGVPVYYSDEEAKKILVDNNNVNQKLIQLFGETIILNDVIDRKKIAEIVFNDKQKLELLNAIIHPAVANHFADWVKKQNSTYVIKEAAILFESGANKQLDKVIWVSAPEELRISRVVKRNKITVEEVKNRMKNQKKEEELMPLADFVIKNDESVSLINQVLQINNILAAK